MFFCLFRFLVFFFFFTYFSKATFQRIAESSSAQTKSDCDKQKLLKIFKQMKNNPWEELRLAGGLARLNKCMDAYIHAC